MNGAANLRYIPGITFGGKDFAISCWLYATAASTAGEGFQAYRDSSNLAAFAAIINDTVNTVTPAASRSPFTAGQWHHFEVDYRPSDNTFFFFFNGDLVDSQADANFATARTFPFYIGYMARSTAYFTGYIDEFFITDQLLHTENFEPPAEPYDFDSDKTIALLHFEN